MNKRYAAILLFGFFAAAVLVPGRLYSVAQGLVVGHMIPMPNLIKWQNPTPRYLSAVVEAGPFSMNRKYVSMEGPSFSRPFSVQNLLASKKIVLPEQTAKRLENLIALCDEKEKTGKPIPRSKIMLPREAIGLVKINNQPRKLYWYKGAKVDVIDEQGRIMPCSEFLCHLGVEINNLHQHNQLFPQATSSHGNEICTLARGITNVMLPPGFGVPVASDEKIRLILMAYKLVDNAPRRIRLRCTLYFLKDEDLNQPMKALNWCRSQIGVMVTKDAHPACSDTAHGGTVDCSSGCGVVSAGEAMPAHYTRKRVSSILYGQKSKVDEGLELSHHWALPPGVHTYRTPVEDPCFSSSYGPIEAVDCHLHTFCQRLCLIECTKDHKEKTLVTVNCRTAIEHSPGTVPSRGLVHIDYPTPGVALNKDTSYVLEVTYNNSTHQKQDAMAGAILLCWDRKFQKPAWAQ